MIPPKAGWKTLTCCTNEATRLSGNQLNGNANNTILNYSTLMRTDNTQIKHDFESVCFPATMPHLTIISRDVTVCCAITLRRKVTSNLIQSLNINY